MTLLQYDDALAMSLINNSRVKPSVRDEMGKTALHIAIEKNRPYEIVRALGSEDP